MKTLPRFWPNQFYKIITGAVLMGLCLLSFAQTTPLEIPEKTAYPGIIETFEKLIQIDTDKISKRTDMLSKTGRVFSDLSTITNLDLEKDFLNSIILHSDPGYLRMASSHKCRFYEGILTDLLKSSGGKIKNVLMTYVEKEKRESAIISKKDFLARVVAKECPDTQKNIVAFQLKTFSGTLKEINFNIPTGVDQCRNTHTEWLNNPQTPFLCQIHEYIKEAKSDEGDPKDLTNRKTIAKILDNKMTMVQRDYIDNLCRHLDDEELFCDSFLNVSFWTKIAAGYEDQFFVKDICGEIFKTETPSDNQYQLCLTRVKKEQDLCHFPKGNPGIRPQPDCDQISTALNFSSSKIKFKDCPAQSDQMIATNIGRIISQFSPGEFVSAQGPCAGNSAATTYAFNKKYDSDENWKLEACYDDKLKEKEVCFKTFFADYRNDSSSYTSVVAEILKRTRGADNSTTCEMVDSESYNPLLLKFKSGCHIIYEKDKCFISQCKHKILLNDRSIDFIRIKNKALLSYFPQNVNEERFSQNYILTRDFKKTQVSVMNLSSMKNYFKKSKNSLVHGIGCAEDLLPTFFKSYTLNQCTPLPFIISGIITDKDKIVLVTRTSADSVQAPRLISWSIIYSAVKSYQRTHPLKLWTMYGLD